jgi:predicted NAD/FAD-dependent oxidoreductase
MSGARTRRRADRTHRLAFASDYLIGPYTEAALTSGLRGADEVTTRLGPEGCSVRYRRE